MQFAICLALIAFWAAALGQDEPVVNECPKDFVNLMKAAQEHCFPKMWGGLSNEGEVSERRRRSDSVGGNLSLRKRDDGTTIVRSRPEWKDDPEGIKEMMDGVPCMEERLKGKQFYDVMSAKCDAQAAAESANDQQNATQVRYDCMCIEIDKCTGFFLWFVAIPWLQH